MGASEGRSGDSVPRSATLLRVVAVVCAALVPLSSCALKDRLAAAQAKPTTSQAAAPSPMTKAVTLPAKDQAYRLCTNCILITKDGKPIRFGGDSVRGELEQVIGYVDQVQLIGWGTDVGGDLPAKAILVYAGDDLVFQGTPNLTRYDVAQALKRASAATSGFSITLPKQLFEDDGAGRKRLMRMFVLSNNDTAVELTYKK